MGWGQGCVQGLSQRDDFIGLPTPCGLECKGHAQNPVLLPTAWFCSGLFRSGSWVLGFSFLFFFFFLSFCILLSRIFSNCAELVVKNPPAMQETQVWSLGMEDPLKREMATHSCTLAWEIPWTEEPGGLPSMGLQKPHVSTHTHTHTEFVVCCYRRCLSRYKYYSRRSQVPGLSLSQTTSIYQAQIIHEALG